MSSRAEILEQRRAAVLRTLAHIRRQQREADANTEWRDLRAQRRRSELLSELFRWYDERLQRIDCALHRGAAPRRPRSRLETRD